MFARADNPPPALYHYPAMNRTNSRSGGRSGGVLKKLLITLVVLIVLLLVIVGAFGPSIASSVLPGYITGGINQSIQGRVELSGLRVGWGAPIKVESFKIIDPQGKQALSARAQIGTGLWRLITGNLDLGTIKVQSDLDLVMDSAGKTNLDAALAPKPGTPAKPAPAGGGGPTLPRAEPLKLPPGLKFNFELEPSSLKLAGADPALIPGGAIELSAIAGTASYAHAGALDARFTAEPIVSGRKTERIDLALNVPQATNADGSLRLKEASGEGLISISLPQVVADVLAARLGLIDASAIQQSGPLAGGEDGALRLSAALKLEGGRLVLAQPAAPPTFAWRLPAGAGAKLSAGAKGESLVALSEGPIVTLMLTQLDLPAAGLLGAAESGGSPLETDWRGGRFASKLSISGMSGTLRLSPDQPAQDFNAEPLLIELTASDLAQGLSALGGTTVNFAGRGAGTLGIRLTAEGLLDDAGKLRSGMPKSVNGFVALENMPTPILQPLAKALDLQLTDLIGPTLTAKVQAITGAPGSAEGGATTLSMSVTGAKIRGGGDFLVSPDRVRSTGDGFELTSTSPRVLIERFAPQTRGRLGGDGLATVSVRDLDLPVVGGKPDFKNTSAGVRALLGQMSARVPGASGIEEAIDISNFETRVSIAPGASPKVALDWRFAAGADRFAVVGALEVPGLIEWTAPEYPHLALSPGTAQPIGKVDLIDIPTRLAVLASENAERLAGAIVGPKLGGVILAEASSGGGSTVQMRFAGDGLDAQGRATLEKQILSIGSEGFIIDLKNPAAAANAVLSDQGVRFSGNTPARVSISDASFKLPRAGEAFSLAGAKARLRKEVGALNARIEPRDGKPGADFSLRSMLASVTLDDGAAALDINADGAYAGQPMQIKGRMTAAVEKALSGGAFELARLPELGLDGSITATRVPVAVAAMAVPDKVELAREFVGETIDLELSANKGSAFSVKANAERLTADAGATLAGTTLNVRPINARATLTPRGVSAAMRQFAPDLKDVPMLTRDAAITLQTKAFDLSIDPRDAQRPIAERLGALSAVVKAESDIELAGIKLDESARRVGAIIRGLEADVTSDQRDPSKSRAIVRAELLNPADAGAPLARVEADAALAASPLSARAKLASIDTARVDRWLGKEGLLAEMLGDRADITANITQPSKDGVMTLAADIASPVVKTALRAEHSSAGTRLLEPATVQWTLSDRWANRYLFTPGPDGKRALVMKGTAPVRIELKRLGIGPGEAPMKPGVFDLDFAGAVPAIDLATEGGVPVRLSGIAINARSTAESPGALVFGLNADQVTSGETGRGASELLRTSGKIVDLADAGGALTGDRARITLDAKGLIPTPIIDALARSGTMYAAVLGPTTTLDLSAQNLSQNSGTLRAAVRSDNTDAAAQGSISNGVFTASAPVKAKLTRITPEASKQFLSKLMPLIENVEKTAEDRPAALDAENLTLPVDGDMTKLNGIVKVDLGTVRFGTSSFLGRVLDVAKVRSKGTAGQRIEPFVMNINRGVAKYDRFKLPLGEFTIETQGTIDLVTRRMDSMVYVPFFAVSKELASVINNDLTAKIAQVPIIDNLTMIPIRVSGSLDNPKTEFAADKFIEENLQGALEKGLEKGIKDALDKGLKDLFKKKN